MNAPSKAIVGNCDEFNTLAKDMFYTLDGKGGQHCFQNLKSMRLENIPTVLHYKLPVALKTGCKF
jgi:hypothetical protein